MKECFKCGETKDFSEFYKHKQMGDGYIGKCKECNKSDVRANRAKKIDYYRAYDRARGARQDPSYIVEYRSKYPNKYKAHTMINNAIRDGRLFKMPCEACKSEVNVHAHHDDYSKPLNVRWLCSAHHSQWHRDNGEAKNP
tara:strand:+ start:703 stop:1122 length:420 start_codon:yes stop_codon:yes gene_type:complete